MIGPLHEKIRTALQALVVAMMFWALTSGELEKRATMREERADCDTERVHAEQPGCEKE